MNLILFYDLSTFYQLNQKACAMYNRTLAIKYGATITIFLLRKHFFCFDNRGTFHDQILGTFHGDPNLRVLTALQQPASGKFRISSVARFEPRTMCYLLGPHFPLYSSGNILMVPELFMELHKCH